MTAALRPKSKISNSEVKAIGWTFWRKSVWNGAACPPVILELKNSSLHIPNHGR